FYPPNNSIMIFRLVAAGLVVVAIFFAMSAIPPAAAQSASPGLTIVESDSNHVVLQLVAPAYESKEQTVNGNRFLGLTIPGFGHTGEAGKPQLPVKGTLIGVPIGANVSLKVLQDESRAESISLRVLPVPTQPVARAVTEAIPPHRDPVIAANSAFYSSNQVYPRDAVSAGEPDFWRSQRVVTVE